MDKREPTKGQYNRTNCYNCGKTVYGKSEANAGGHVFCCRNCRAAWERAKARKAQAIRRAEHARRIHAENARIAAENARRDAEAYRLRQEEEWRNKRNKAVAWGIAGAACSLALFPVTTSVVAVAGLCVWKRNWIREKLDKHILHRDAGTNVNGVDAE